MTITFTAGDHVTEREPGPWRDCTFASMLETLRLGLPNGRAIPSAQPEVERFRAAAGFPDNHAGATIEQTIPAARRLYGLTDDDFTTTRDVAVLERVLADRGLVGVVTGSMGAVPTSLRRHDPAFRGAHAVAFRSPLVWCDPLAPAGSYAGEPVALPTWRRFALALPGWQAFVMAAQGGDEMIAAGGIRITSDKRARVTTETAILDAPDGKRIATAKVNYVYPYLGAAAGYRAVLVNTAIPYPDTVKRPTVLYLAASAVTIEDAPPEPSGATSNSAVVTLTVNGTVDYSRTF